MIEAIAAGKAAPVSIERFVDGQDRLAGRETLFPVVTEFDKQGYHPAKQARMPVVDPKARVNNFKEVQLGLTEAMAVEVAKRCLG